MAKTDVCSLCVACTRTRGRGLETSTNAMHFWKSGFEFAFGRNKKGKVFGISSQFLLSKSNDVHSQNKTFLAVRNELLLRLKIDISEGGDVTFIH